MTLLCRTAENLYWMGRYLERAESLTRLVREHTALLADLPTSVPLNWEPLLGIPGETEPFFSRFDRASESNVMSYLLADGANPTSLPYSLRNARENLRTTRATMPRGSWRILNELVQYATSSAELGCQRGYRHEFCERIIAGCQRLTGFLHGSMGRDPAWDFYQLGVHLERADMTSRVLDVRAGGLMSGPEEATAAVFRDSQWVSMLRSLDGLQLYRRVTGALVEGERVVAFVVGEPLFPRSIRGCVRGMASVFSSLPSQGRDPQELVPLTAVEELLDRPSGGRWTHDTLHQLSDDVQLALAGVHHAIGEAYFRLGEADGQTTSRPSRSSSPQPAPSPSPAQNQVQTVVSA